MIDFLKGLGTVPRAFLLVVRTPRLRRLAVIPAGLSVVLFGVLAAASIHWSGTLLEWLWPHASETPGAIGAFLGALRAVAHFLASLLLVLLSGVAALLASLVIGEPFVDLLAEAAEKTLGCTAVEAGWNLRRLGRDMLLTVADTGVDLGLFLGVQALLLLLFLAPGVGPMLHFALGLTASAVFCAAAMTASTLGRHGYHGLNRWRRLRRSPARMLGTGFGILLLLSVPLLQVFALPFAVVAGTITICDEMATGGRYEP